MRPKRRRLLIWLVYLLLLLGLATVSGEVLALTIPLAIYLVVALVRGPGELHLRVTRSLSDDRVYEGVPVHARVRIANEGSRLAEVLMQDLVPKPLEIVEGESSVLASLPAGTSIELNYTVKGERGHYEFGHVRLTGNEPLGLFWRRTVSSVPVRLSIMPGGMRLRSVPLRPFRTRGYAGPIPARQGGSGTDFFGVREYQMGDPRRWINWRVSARHPHNLFTNEFERERIADVGLILDARRRTDVRVPSGVQASQDSLFEHAIRAAAALAETFLADGNRVGLLVYGAYLDWTFPGYGKVQRERILRALARAELGESQVFEQLDYLPTRLFPAQSQIVLVSPLVPEDLGMLVRLRARGYQVLVIRPDPVTFEARALGPGKAVELAARFVRVERHLLVLKLRQAGIQVVDWPVNRPFDQTVHAALGRAPQWFRAVGVE